jgi:AraC-like DNA-binding protein
MLNRRLHTRTEILHHPLFLSIERQIALHLIGIHKRVPRLARLAASHRKWLLTQTLFSMHLGRDPHDPLSGLTATRLIQAATDWDVSSRNTASAFLAELVAYRFLRDAPGELPDRRVRRLETTEISEEAMSAWFQGHMACLDRLDGGNRATCAEAEPRIFRIAQPHAAAAFLQEPIWKEPRPSIGHFLWSDVGGLVLHELISRLPDDAREHDRIPIAQISLSWVAAEYGISLTNVKRMFKKAEADGCLGWEEQRNGNMLWLARTFIEDYFVWQSTKFAALDEAVHWAVVRL